MQQKRKGNVWGAAVLYSSEKSVIKSVYLVVLFSPCRGAPMRSALGTGKSIYALGVLNRYSSRRFHFEPVALVRRNSKADPIHSAMKKPFEIKISPGPLHGEPNSAISAITATNA